MASILAIPHIQDFAFVLVASQLGSAIQPGPKTQTFLRQTFVGPAIVFAFVMLKNARYTTREAMVVGIVALILFYGIKMLP